MAGPVRLSDALSITTMVTVSMTVGAWEAILAAARTHHEDLVTGVADGLYDADKNAETIATLGAALDDVDQQPLPEPNARPDVAEQDDAQEEQQFLNHYTCPRCNHEWSDQWSAMCDDDCPSCGMRHISPTHSEDVN